MSYSVNHDRRDTGTRTCRLWDWRNALGRSKDMAARTLLLKLERSGHIQMPPRQRPSSNEFRNVVVPATETIHGVLCDLRPLSFSVARI